MPPPLSKKFDSNDWIVEESENHNENYSIKRWFYSVVTCTTRIILKKLFYAWIVEESENHNENYSIKRWFYLIVTWTTRIILKKLFYALIIGKVVRKNWQNSVTSRYIPLKNYKKRGTLYLKIGSHCALGAKTLCSLLNSLLNGHVRKYEAVFVCVLDIWIIVTFWSTYKVVINYAPIINRINYLSEKVPYSKNDIITKIYLKILGTKKR